tara:strand:+ start:46830 stop:47714 length:885 start_codon:yes stop_codon:yes gene_type:complete
MSDAVAALIAAERLPDDYREVVERFWQPLADRIAREATTHKPLIVGINGAQGSGKSTLCRFLEVLLKPRGLRVVTLSLDDLYLTRAERADMAAKVHPLFATRGVPGTHAVGMALGLIEDMLAGRGFTLPRFDKSVDDRADAGEVVSGPVDVLLFEGWCVGAAPQDPAALAEAINQLEAEEDRGGVWRGLVNRFLAGDYADLFAQIDLLVMLKVEGFEAVAANRRLQEHKLAEATPGAPGLMDETALTRFLDHYERLTRHQLAEMPARADVLFEIGPDQRPTRLPDGLKGTRSIT